MAGMGGLEAVSKGIRGHCKSAVVQGAGSGGGEPGASLGAPEDEVPQLRKEVNEANAKCKEVPPAVVSSSAASEGGPGGGSSRDTGVKRDVKALEQGSDSSAP
eukprot:2802134-Rhodomonas_salina.1